MSMKKKESILERVRPRFVELATEGKLLQADVKVFGRPLTVEEAIGVPGRRDFPIIIGKERVLEAVVLGSRGQAYTDSVQEFDGTVKQVVELDLNTNQNRAIYVATLNAVMRYQGIIKKTVHCKDEEPEQCALDIAAYLLEKYGKVSVGLVGLNPAIAERLADTFGAEHVHITDLFEDNIGKKRFGVEIWDGRTRTEDLIVASDVLVSTGTTLINGTYDSIRELVEIHGKTCIVYGITAIGIADIVGHDRICPCGREE